MKLRLSPTLFLILEFFIVLPSVLFICGVIEYLINGTGFIIFYVTGLSILRGLFVTIVTPFASGFLAYNYVERYKLQPWVKTVAKVILGYSIVEIGLVLIFSASTLLHL